MVAALSTPLRWLWNLQSSQPATSTTGVVGLDSVCTCHVRAESKSFTHSLGAPICFLTGWFSSDKHAFGS